MIKTLAELGKSDDLTMYEKRKNFSRKFKFKHLTANNISYLINKFKEKPKELLKSDLTTFDQAKRFSEKFNVNTPHNNMCQTRPTIKKTEVKIEDYTSLKEATINIEQPFIIYPLEEDKKTEENNQNPPPHNTILFETLSEIKQTNKLFTELISSTQSTNTKINEAIKEILTDDKKIPLIKFECDYCKGIWILKDKPHNCPRCNSPTITIEEPKEQNLYNCPECGRSLFWSGGQYKCNRCGWIGKKETLLEKQRQHPVIEKYPKLKLEEFINKKKQEAEPQKENPPNQVTYFKCPTCGENAVFPRSDGTYRCNACKWVGYKKDIKTLSL